MDPLLKAPDGEPWAFEMKQAFSTRVEAVTSRVEAIALGLEAIPTHTSGIGSLKCLKGV